MFRSRSEEELIPYVLASTMDFVLAFFYDADFNPLRRMVDRVGIENNSPKALPLGNCLFEVFGITANLCYA